VSFLKKKKSKNLIIQKTRKIFYLSFKIFNIYVFFLERKKWYIINYLKNRKNFTIFKNRQYLCVFFERKINEIFIIEKKEEDFNDTIWNFFVSQIGVFSSALRYFAFIFLIKYIIYYRN